MPPGYRCNFGFRYTSPVTHRVNECSIGPWPEYGYSSARQVAYDLWVKVHRGIDPVIEERENGAKRITFKEAAEAWLKVHSTGWRNPTQLRNANRMLFVYGEKLLNLPIATVNADQIHAVLNPRWAERPKAVRKALATYYQMFEYVAGMGWRTEPNPARWPDVQQYRFPRQPEVSEEHYPSLPYAELPNFIRELRSGDSAAALCLELIILTTTRLNETLGMQWSEVNWDTKLWTIPATRMKTNVEHRIPLSDRAIEILKLRTQYQRPFDLHERSIRWLLRDRPITVHGFRASFKTWSLEQTEYAWELVEMCLSHRVGTEVAQRYVRGEGLERRRQIMDAWAAYCG
jgi:integrase